ncbi:MAG: ABC transporter ATP-binding protein [Euryarchaeota archaeon]|nr:ABC transporter ATP-binding protein [Euryarchaeota archaeon]
MISKTAKCPSCKTHVTIQGNPGEKVLVNCPKCNLKGYFTIPGVKTEASPVSIEICSLTKIYKDVKAVENLSFNVRKGEVFGFLGPNGAGKTTTIKAMLGLIHVTSGDIKINGFDMKKNGIDVKKDIGYLPERVSFYDNLTPVQTLNFFCELKGADKSVVPSLIKEVGLEEAMNRKVGTFSKGMVQLLGVAQALIGNPSIYILDEPTAGLDARWVRIVREKIKMLNERGATIIFSSHVLSEVEALCDRVAIINKGKLIAEDTVANLNKYLHIKPRIEISIEGLDGKVPKVLENLDGVETADAKGDTLLVTCEPHVRSHVMAALEEAGFKVANIKTIEPSLEDAFVKLIEGDT